MLRDVRKELVDVLRSLDVFLNTEQSEKPLTEKERRLLEAYMARTCKKFNVSVETVTEGSANEGHGFPFSSTSSPIS